MRSRAARTAVAAATTLVASALLAAGAGAETITTHKGGVKGDKKAKVSFKLVKSDDGLMTEIRSFKVKKLKLDCGRRTKRVTVRAGNALLTGDDPAVKATFGLGDSGTSSYDIAGTVKKAGQKASGGIAVNSLQPSPSGIERCLAQRKFTTKQK